MKKISDAELFREKQYGFFLLELLVSIALIILCTHIVFASWTSLYRIITRTELTVLETTSMCLQHHALLTQQPQTIRFDQHKNSYTIGNAVYNLPYPVQFGILGHVKGPPSSPLQHPHNPITFTNNTITYYKNGVIQAGTVYLTDAARSCQYALSNAVGAISYIRKYIFAKKWQRI